MKKNSTRSFLILSQLLFLFGWTQMQGQNTPGATQGCFNNNISFNITPEPVDGAYEPGDVVEVCATFAFTQPGAIWVHGVQVYLPDGWDPATLNPSSMSSTCGGGTGTWTWQGPGTFYGDTYGVGYYYLGHPSNWGQSCFNGTFTMCYEVTVDADCGGPGSPLNGEFIFPGFTVTGDNSSTGSGGWGGGGGGIPCDGVYVDASFDPNFPVITIDCCDAESGTSPGTLNICNNGTFDLFYELGPPVDGGGSWEDPNGQSGTGDSYIFDPLTSPPGDYTYTVFGTDDCVSSTTITMEFISLGQYASITRCNSDVFTIESALPPPPFGPFPDPGFNGTWTAPDGVTTLPDGEGTFVPGTNVSGVYTYTFLDGNNCPTTLTVNITVIAGGSIPEPANHIDVCLTDPPFMPFDSLAGTPPSLSTASWVYEPSSGGFNFIPGGSGAVVDPSNWSNATPPQPLESGYMYYFAFAGGCFSSDTLFFDVFEPPNTGDFAEVNVCITDPPVSLTSLLDGTPDDSLTWTLGSTVIPDMFDPSDYDEGDALILNYSGGLAGTSCFQQTSIVVTILPADADAGEFNSVDICETDAAVCLTDLLGGTPQAGGEWTSPSGVTSGCIFNPATGESGTWTYTITTTCDSDTQTLEVNVINQADAGTDGTLAICDNETDIPLFGGPEGTPDPGGEWTLGGNPVGELVNGNAVNDGDVYTYTVGTGNCQDISTVTIDLQIAPFAGTAPAGPLVLCEADAPIALIDQWDTPPSNPPAAPNASWSGPGGFTGNILNPATAQSGTYTYTITTTVCGSDTESIDIVIEPVPNAGTDAAITVCPNETGAVNLLTELGADPGGSWTAPPGGPTGGTFNPGDPAGDYVYELNPSGVCGASATVTVNVPALPDPGTDGAVTVCESDPAFNLIDFLGGTPEPTFGQWNAPNSDPFGPPNATFTPGTDAPGTYTYTAGDGTCPVVTAEVVVTVLDDPNAGDNTTITVCETLGTVDLTGFLGGTPDAGGTWSVPNPYDISAICGTTENLTYTVDNGTCQDVAILSLTVECTPNAGGNGILEFCSDDPCFDLSDGLTPPFDAVGTWTNANGDVVPNNQCPNALGAGEVFTYTVGGIDCAASTATVTVDITEAMAATNIQADCEASQLTYVVSFEIQDGQGPFEISGTEIAGTVATGAVYTSNPIPAGTNYAFTVTDNSNCDDLTVSGAAPNCACPATASFITGNQTICAGDDAVLEFDVTGAPPFDITVNDGTADIVFTGYTAGATVTVSPANTTTYTLISVEDANCENSATGSVIVNVDQPTNAGPDVVTELCSPGGNLTLSSILDAAADTPGQFTGPSGVVTTVPYTPASSGIYTYTPQGNSCPADNAEYDITIYNPISVSDISTSCNAAQTEYTVTFTIAGGTGTYNVTGMNGGTVTGNTFTSNPIDPTGDPIYGFDVSDNGPCAEVDVTGNAPNCACPATAALTGGGQTICSGETASLPVNLQGDGPWTVIYDAGGVAGGPVVLNAGETIDVTPAVTTIYTLTSVEDQNCVGSVSGNITVTVDNPTNAGPNVEVPSLCGGPGNLNLESLLDPGADTPGTFTINGNTMTSVPLTSASSGVYTYTTEANACPSDDATYEITIFDPIEVNAVSVECNLAQTEYTVSFDISGGTGTYTVTGTVDGTLTGNTFTSDLIDGDAEYSFTIDDDGPCGEVVISDLEPDCDCQATGSLSGSTNICAGSSTDIIVTLVGVPPFSITYQNSNDPGNPTTLNNIFNGHAISVSPGTSATYTLTSISDANCTGAVEGDPVDITVDSPLSVGDANITCDDTGDTYTVQIVVTGGVAPINVTNSTGGTGPVYTSNSFNSGSSYTMVVSDAGACPNVTSSGSFTCPCTTEAGSLLDNSFEICTNESATVTPDGNAVLDGNDTFQYVLHDGSPTELGTVLLISNDGTFTYDGSLETGAVYYISAVAGNENAQGNVNLNDPCLSVSNGLDIMFYDLPTATFAGDLTVCAGSEAELVINFTGQGPWSFAYELNGQPEPGTVESAGSSTILAVTEPGTYTITDVTDANCSDNSGSEATVNTFDTPTAVIGGDPEVCANSGNGPEVTFTGAAPWTFEYSINGEIQTAVTTSSNPHTIPAFESGTYALESLSDANCEGTVSGSLDVTFLEVPVANLTGGGTVCAGDSAVFNVALTGQAPWTIAYTVDGVPQTPLTSDVPNFTFESGMSGTYAVTSVTDQVCQGLSHNNDASLIVNATPSGEISASTNLACIGQEVRITFTLQGNGPFNVIYAVNGTETALNGIAQNHILTLAPTEPMIIELLSIEDSSTPVCSSEEVSNSIFVQVTELPNAPVLTDDTICSGGGHVPIGVPSAPGLSYIWTPTTGLSDPKVSNPTLSRTVQGTSPRVYTYILTASNEDCSVSDTVNITVEPRPQARFRFSPDPVTSEDPRIFFLNTSIATETTQYFWDFGGLGSSTSRNPDFRFPEGRDGDYTVTLTAVDPVTGCTSTYTAGVRVRNELLVYVPNAFTPDGDGKNDLWGPVLTNIEKSDYRLTIFDRLGNVVFETTDINQKWNGGQMNSGYYLEAGMYIWVIEGREIGAIEDFEMRGHVILLR